MLSGFLFSISALATRAKLQFLLQVQLLGLTQTAPAGILCCRALETLPPLPNDCISENSESIMAESFFSYLAVWRLTLIHPAPIPVTRTCTFCLLIPFTQYRSFPKSTFSTTCLCRNVIHQSQWLFILKLQLYLFIYFFVTGFVAQFGKQQCFDLEICCTLKYNCYREDTESWRQLNCSLKITHLFCCVQQVGVPL